MLWQVGKEFDGTDLLGEGNAAVSGGRATGGAKGAAFRGAAAAAAVSPRKAATEKPNDSGRVQLLVDGLAVPMHATSRPHHNCNLNSSSISERLLVSTGI